MFDTPNGTRYFSGMENSPAIPLIQTKIGRPRAAGDMVARPRLVARLNQGLEGGSQLSLICAPAGYGKTTLAGQWLAGLDRPLAWLSLDEGDNDPVSFLTYLAAATQEIDGRIGRGLDQATLAGSPMIDQATGQMAGLINEMASLAEPFVLVLDDYHLIEEPAVHLALRALVDNQPAKLHLVIISRADPPIGVAGLRARGRLTEVRAGDLRFTSEETATFLNELMALKLDPEDARSLGRRTEGWPAGLRLAALSMQGRSDKAGFIAAFAGGHHYVMDYLSEEVLSRQPPAVLDFLTRTSILERMNADLCDAVTGNDDGRGDSRAMLDHLLGLNLFVIPLDDERRWFRYHQLFADLLGNRLRRSMPAAEIRELHRRAAVWYGENGYLDPAVIHGLKGGDYDGVARLLETAVDTMLGGRLATLLGWLNALPVETLDAHPRLPVYRGWTLFLGGRGEEAQTALLSAREALDARPAGPDTDPLRGELASMLATVATLSGDVERTRDEATIALARLPEEDLVSRARARRALGTAQALAGDTDGAVEMWRAAGELAAAGGVLFQAADALANVAAIQVHQGRLRDAARSYEEVIALGRRPDGRPLPFAALGYTGLAALYLERNRLQEARESLEQGAGLGRLAGIGYNQVAALSVEAGLHWASGREEKAEGALARAEDSLATFPSLPDAVHLTSIRSRMRIPRRWSSPEDSSSLEPDNLPVVLREIQLITLARLALDRDRPGEVAQLCETILATAEEAGRQARVIEARLLAALALAAQEIGREAQAALTHSLTLAEPEGYKRLYLDEGQPAAALLAAFLDDPASPEHLRPYAAGLLGAFEGGTAAGEALVEPLSERELEVVRLVAEGLTNQQIAARLIITLHTVKKHTSNIYGKLGVSSRTQAVARARELGLF